jgi:hypothetical protein
VVATNSMMCGGAKEVRAQPLATIRLDGSELLSLSDHRIQGRRDPRHGPPLGCRRLGYGSVQSLSFEKLRALNEWGKWSEKDMKQMRHYGITFTGSTRNLLRAAPKAFETWTGRGYLSRGVAYDTLDFLTL